MKVNLVQYYKTKKGWELAGLDDDEMQKASEVLRTRNKHIFEECLTDAGNILKQYQNQHNTNLEILVSVAQQLFERQAIHASFILDAVLKRKIFELREAETKSS